MGVMCLLGKQKTN